MKLKLLLILNLVLLICLLNLNFSYELITDSAYKHNKSHLDFLLNSKIFSKKNVPNKWFLNYKIFIKDESINQSYQYYFEKWKYLILDTWFGSRNKKRIYVIKKNSSKIDEKLKFSIWWEKLCFNKLFSHPWWIIEVEKIQCINKTWD